MRPELAAWRRSCAHVFGVAPEFDDDGALLRFPRTRDALGTFERMIGRVAPYGDRPAVLGHLQRLGCRWDDDGWFLTLPAPGTLRTRLAKLGFSDCGFETAWTVTPLLAPKHADWFAQVTSGVLPITIAAPPMQRLLRGTDPLRRVSGWDWYVRTSLLAPHHDLSVHALSTHLLPGELIRTLGRRAAAAVRSGAFVHRPLTTFYESDLYGYCMAVWRLVERPESFARIALLPENVAQLEAALERRVAMAPRGGRPWGRPPREPELGFALVRGR